LAVDRTQPGREPEELAPPPPPASTGPTARAAGATRLLRHAAAWLAATLAESPAALPGLAVVAMFVAWASEEGGYPLTSWAPGGLVMIGLLAVTTLAGGWRRPRLSAAGTLALACLAGYTAWSFASIAWAGVRADAWEGADRTLLYLLVFALFAGFGLRPRAAALLMVCWTLSLAGLAAYVLVHMEGAGAGLRAAFPEGRLLFPVGYVNAQAAQWMMAAWPALLLARSPRLHPALRGVLAGAAVLLSDVALLSLSRGALLASAIVLVLVCALLPGRLRTFAVLVPVALGVGLSTPAILRVGDRLEGGAPSATALGAAHSALNSASTTIFLASALVALAVALAASLDRSALMAAGALRARVRRALAVCALATLIGVVAGGLAVAGNPVARVRHAWNTFTSPKGYAANSSGTNRLLGGLGSNRYDFYRVALDEFAAHPVLGIGADNFAQGYLLHGRSPETPRYPHSVELRTLADTGIVGALLAIAGLAAALLAAARAVRRGDALQRTVAAAAIAGFGYWVVHGSADWFWEYAGLGAPAFALLGMACALDPGRVRARTRTRALLRGMPRPPAIPSRTLSRMRRLLSGPSRALGDALRALAPRRRLPAGFAMLVVALVAAGSFAAPWISELQVQSAARGWTTAPAAAYARLEEAAQWNPLSAQPYLLAGSIALRLGELEPADRYFARGLARSPNEQYATLERGAIASQRGERTRAIELLRRALALYPRDRLASAALSLTRAGGRVSVAELNAAIYGQARQFE
jgi:tetratricopeptide (TPR) repeat protein